MDRITSLAQLNTAVARQADTAGTQITVAETARVLRCLWRVLGQQPTNQVLRLVSRGLASAAAETSSPE